MDSEEEEFMSHGGTLPRRDSVTSHQSGRVVLRSHSTKSHRRTGSRAEAKRASILSKHTAFSSPMVGTRHRHNAVTLFPLRCSTLPCPAGERHHPWPAAPGQIQRMQQSDGFHALPQPAHVPAALRSGRHHWFLHRSNHLQHSGGVLPQPAQTEGTSSHDKVYKVLVKVSGIYSPASTCTHSPSSCHPVSSAHLCVV